MTSLPATQNAPRSIDSVLRTDSKSVSGRLHAAMADPNLFIVAAICMIGLLVTLNLIFRFASFGSGVDQLGQILG
jgi:hypothetical protein